MNQQLSIDQICEILPHRYPFLLIDRVLNWTSHVSITALKNVSMNEPFFQGHFPSHPIMPGVLIVEALAQSAGILAYLSDHATYHDYLYYLAAVESAKFRYPVVPGDALRLEVNFTARKAKFDKVSGLAYVSDRLVCEVSLISSKKEKESEYAARR